MSNTLTPSFPKDFVWGAAAASYQIEGAWNRDGKGPSIWDTYSREPGKIWSNHTGEEACDHYHRYVEDVGIMREIGLKAYRMSISWPRILPAGVGAVNAAGLDFYDRLIDALCAAGVDPWVTLYHWDLPYALHLRGGWLNREIAEWFADYAAIVVDRLSDRVTHWMTLNEVQNFCTLGYLTGEHAPGYKLSTTQILITGHHALLAHGKGVQAIRAHTRKPCLVGYAPAGFPTIPQTESTEDIEAARRAMLGNDNRHAWGNAWFMDPVVLGAYPEKTIPQGAVMPTIESDDLATIHQPLDFFGVNIYWGDYIRAGGDEGFTNVPLYPGFPMSRYNWAVAPEAMRWGTKFLYEKYRLPLVITENGLSLTDWVALDGKVHDPQRIDFLTRYLRELKRSMDEGTDVRGYFHWSIMDNFEWQQGYRERFGLVYVDYRTKERTLKDSAYWYRDLIASNGGIL